MSEYGTMGVSANYSGDAGYPHYLEKIREHFDALTAENTPLFTTDAQGLFAAYLDSMPEENRQHYNCHNCRRFIEQYGALVVISDDGEIEPVMWGDAGYPEFFAAAVAGMRDIVKKARVTGVFLHASRALGTAVTGDWKHMAVAIPRARMHKGRLKTADQAAAEKLEGYRALSRSLTEYSGDTVRSALELLKSETLYRSDAVLGVAEWLAALHERRAAAGGSRARENITWLAVATAPDGYYFVKSSMIGTLLDDIADGFAVADVARRFAAKMAPTQYRRTQTAPDQGNIDRAEEIVAKLGIANSLKRRYAKFDEIPEFIWRRTEEKPKEPTGVFSGIEAREKTASTDGTDLPDTVMTWEKFSRTVLPDAVSIEARVDRTERFMAMVTASDETASNILQWDNGFSWYYHSGIDGEIRRRVEAAGGRYENNEIRCSLIWEGYTDLDLHCITPEGKHIYFGDRRFGTGWLDVDANGGSPTTRTPVENIRWSERAPVGEYLFYVHNFEERGNGFTPYKVELEIGGEIFVVNAVATSTGYKADAFRFEYQSGRRPVFPDARTGIARDEDRKWNLTPNSFVPVKGITTSPNLWGDREFSRAGRHMFFLLEGCLDPENGLGRGFFTEMLLPELHEIRRTLEAYAASSAIDGAEDATACGVGFTIDGAWDLLLRVTTANSKRLIKIDRWD